MQNHCSEQIRLITEMARRELAAYLRALWELHGCTDSVALGGLWMDTMQSLDWPNNDYENFFRKVTIHTLRQLAHPEFSSTIEIPEGNTHATDQP